MWNLTNFVNYGHCHVFITFSIPNIFFFFILNIFFFFTSTECELLSQLKTSSHISGQSCARSLLVSSDTKSDVAFASFASSLQLSLWLFQTSKMATMNLHYSRPSSPPPASGLTHRRSSPVSPWPFPPLRKVQIPVRRRKTKENTVRATMTN